MNAGKSNGNMQIQNEWEKVTRNNLRTKKNQQQSFHNVYDVASITFNYIWLNVSRCLYLNIVSFRAVTSGGIEKKNLQLKR